jgi:hypothetical protein
MSVALNSFSFIFVSLHSQSRYLNGCGPRGKRSENVTPTTTDCLRTCSKLEWVGKEPRRKQGMKKIKVRKSRLSSGNVATMQFTIFCLPVC